MTLPRWAESQTRVEDALRAGMVTREEIIEATKLSPKTVISCLRRATLETVPSWPRQYRLIRSALADFDEPQEREAEILPFPVKPVVEPKEFEVETLGPIWQRGKDRIASEISDTDMATMDRDVVLGRLETLTAQLLGVIVALRLVEDGPEWREDIGLD